MSDQCQIADQMPDRMSDEMWNMRQCLRVGITRGKVIYHDYQDYTSYNYAYYCSPAFSLSLLFCLERQQYNYMMLNIYICQLILYITMYCVY